MIIAQDAQAGCGWPAGNYWHASHDYIDAVIQDQLDFLKEASDLILLFRMQHGNAKRRANHPCFSKKLSFGKAELSVCLIPLISKCAERHLAAIGIRLLA